MAITAGTPTAVGGAASTTTLTVNLPGTVTTDGILLMRVSNVNLGTASISTPTGWTAVPDGAQNCGAGNAGHAMFWKAANASDSGGSVTVSNPAGGSCRWMVVQLLGIDPISPFGHSLGGALGSNAASFTTGALTITGTNPSGKKYMLGFVQSTGGFFTHSAESANGFTGQTVTEISDTQGALLVLISANTSTATSTFSDTQSASVRASWTILDLVEVSTSVTGSSAQTLPSFTQSGAGTRTVPTSTGTAASGLAAFTQAAAGTRTVPVSTGTGTSGLAAVTQQGAGTRTVPVFTGASAQTLPSVTQAAAGTNAAPTFTGSADSTLAALGQMADGAVTAPVFTADATSGLAPLEQTAEGTYAAPQTGGTAVSSLPRFGQAATGTFVPPVFTATAAAELPGLAQSAAGDVTAPPISGDGASVLGALTQSATGTAAGPLFTGTAASLLAALTQETAGTVADLPCVILRPTGTTTRVLALIARPGGITERPGCD